MRTRSHTHMASQSASHRTSHCTPHYTGGKGVGERALEVVNCLTQRYLSLVFSICCYSTSTVYDGDAEDGTELTALLPRAGGGDGGTSNGAEPNDDSTHRDGAAGDDAGLGPAHAGSGGHSLVPKAIASTPTTPGPSSAGEPQALFAVPPYDPDMDLP